MKRRGGKEKGGGHGGTETGRGREVGGRKRGKGMGGKGGKEIGGRGIRKMGGKGKGGQERCDGKGGLRRFLSM